MIQAISPVRMTAPQRVQRQNNPAQNKVNFRGQDHIGYSGFGDDVLCSLILAGVGIVGAVGVAFGLRACTNNVEQTGVQKERAAIVETIKNHPGIVTEKNLDSLMALDKVRLPKK